MKDKMNLLTETETPGFTIKGSRFRKSVYRYPTVLKSTKAEDISDKLIVEINSFANPYPNQQATIQSMISEFFQNNGALNKLNTLVTLFKNSFSIVILR